MRSQAENSKKPVVCVQGLGFVGAAMALVIADVRDKNRLPVYDVVGVDLETAADKIDALNRGEFPFETTDVRMTEASKRGMITGNFRATTDVTAFSKADIVLIDVNLDLIDGKIALEPFRKAVRTIGENIRENTLIIVETTVPPGACRHVVRPTLQEAFMKRGLREKGIFIAHSYERVMPGANYWDSMVNYWRVYAGLTNEAADRCEQFLSTVLNVGEYPLTRLESIEASETAKVMENSYRAVNIAFIEEWSRMAERIGVDLFAVIDAIRKRPSHANMMQPGFGVGGYCLTKDPLFAELAAHELFSEQDITFPFSKMAVKINNQMPCVSVDAIDKKLGGLHAKNILLLGVSYRQDVADTRYSPSEIFVKEAETRGARVVCQDPLVKYWKEMQREVLPVIPDLSHFDCMVFAVPHRQYQELEMEKWPPNQNILIFDANHVLTERQRNCLEKRNISFASIGRGAKNNE